MLRGPASPSPVPSTDSLCSPAEIKEVLSKQSEKAKKLGEQAAKDAKN